MGRGGPAAAAYEPCPGFGELDAVLGEVVDVLAEADVAADDLGEAGVGEGSDGACRVRHLTDDLHHPLRTDGTVRPRKVGSPGGDLTRRPPRQPFRERLTVLDEGLVRQDRRTQSPDRLVGEPQLDEVGEGLEKYRIGPAFEERFGLLQKDGLRQLRTDGTYRGERTSERTNGPEDERPVTRSRDGTWPPCGRGWRPRRLPRAPSPRGRGSRV